MENDVTPEAVGLYRNARNLLIEMKRLTKEAEEAKRSGQDWIAIGNHRSHQKKLEALSLFERIEALGENNQGLQQHQVYALAKRNLGVYGRTNNGNHERVIDDLTRALSLGVKKDAAVCHRLGMAYILSWRIKEAIGPLKEAVEFNERDGWARYWLCNAYLDLGEKENAREQYEALRQMPPGIHAPHHHVVAAMERRFEKGKCGPLTSLCDGDTTALQARWKKLS